MSLYFLFCFLLKRRRLLLFTYLGTSFVTVWALFLPKVEHSLYFHRDTELTENNKCQSNDIAVFENAPVS